MAAALIGDGDTDGEESARLEREAFSEVSSRTYMSSLERDQKSPTLHKLTELCGVMDVHPLGIRRRRTRKVDRLPTQGRRELKAC